MHRIIERHRLADIGNITRDQDGTIQSIASIGHEVRECRRAKDSIAFAGDEYRLVLLAKAGAVRADELRGGGDIAPEGEKLGLELGLVGSAKPRLHRIHEDE